MPGDPLHDAPWAVVETKRFLLYLVFIAAIAAAGLGRLETMTLGVLICLAAYLLVTLLHVLWGDRMRPKNTPMWWLLGIAAAIPIVFGMFGAVPSPELLVAPPLALAAAAFYRHDQSLTPSLFLGGAVLAALFMHGRMFSVPIDLSESDAVWIAISVLFGLVAATLEHERLLRRKGAGTPLPWTTIRVAFVALWTLIILSLREDVQWGRIFVWLGADLSGRSGQMFLIGIIVVGIVLAAFAFRPSKKKSGQ